MNSNITFSECLQQVCQKPEQQRHQTWKASIIYILKVVLELQDTWHNPRYNFNYEENKYVYCMQYAYILVFPKL